MQTYDHSKSHLFSLVGRRVRLHKPYYAYAALDESLQGFQDGTIVEQIGPARFGLHLDGYTRNDEPITVDFHRAEFKLPPLPRSEREPVWLDDDFDGFVYADVPTFNSWRGK
jgi:hypothetical protein